MRLRMRLRARDADLKGSSARSIACSELVVRGGVEPPTFRFSGGRSYQLSYLTVPGPLSPGEIERPERAVLTGLEPATSTLTGWRANRLLYRTMHAGYLPAVPPTGFEPVPPP